MSSKKSEAEKKEKARKKAETINWAREKHSKALVAVKEVNRRIKYLLGMSLQNSLEISMIETKNVETVGEAIIREAKLEQYLKQNFKITSEYHWIETGIAQRGFDVIRYMIVKLKDVDHLRR